jgi:FKBP-type peptidyl-prolyl cis-trans isomerase SlyD
MKVEAKKAVSIEYTLKDDKGEVLDSSVGRDPLTYLHGADNIVAGLERALEGKAVNDAVEVVVSPADGYGDRDESLLRNVPIRKLEGDVQVGAWVRLKTPEGVRMGMVTSRKSDYAIIDTNHPLAGKTLHFQVKVTAIRDANEDELAHGHVHDGHHHH